MKQPGNGLCETSAERFLRRGERPAACARGVCTTSLVVRCDVKRQVRHTMASWTLLVFTSSYKRKPKPNEMKVCWKKPNQRYQNIIKAFIGVLALLLYVAGGEGCFASGRKAHGANRRRTSRSRVCLPLLLVGVSGNIPLFPLASHHPDFWENPTHLPCFLDTSEGKVL